MNLCQLQPVLLLVVWWKRYIQGGSLANFESESVPVARGLSYQQQHMWRLYGLLSAVATPAVYPLSIPELGEIARGTVTLTQAAAGC